MRRIGYTDPALGFHDGCEVQVRLIEQSADIARGVDRALEVPEQAGPPQPAVYGHFGREDPGSWENTDRAQLLTADSVRDMRG